MTPSTAAFLRNQQQRRRQRGTSLLEIMVVLVVLLLGVFTIIRIFPIGFQTLRAAENRTLATRLATGLAEQASADAASVPNGVLTKFLNNGELQTIYANDDRLSGPQVLDPDNMDPLTDDGTSEPYFTDVNKFRSIEGEPVKIPLPTTTGYGSGSVYTLKFGPIFMSEEVGDPETGLGNNTFLKVSGAPLIGIRVEAGDPDNQRGYLRGPQTYLIDYGDDNTPAQILFNRNRSSRPVVYTVKYSYEDAATSNVLTTQDTITMAAGEDSTWKALSNQDVADGSDEVRRDFVRLPANAAFDNNEPYEYKLLSANVGKYANFGVVAFNPAGANYSERTPYGQQAFTAFLDYAVLDWHIIRDDREVPSVLTGSDNAIPIKTTLSFIKRVGEPEPDNTIYNGLYRDSDEAHDIEVFDLSGTARFQPPLGEHLETGDYDKRTTTDADKDIWINYDERGGTYRSGTIYVNKDRVPPGTQLRILYKAEGEWAVSLQKAYSTYEQALRDDGGVSPDPRKYDSFGKQGQRLVFHRNDLNKSVVATIEYRPSGSSDLVRLAPFQMTISEVGTGTQDAGYAFVNVRDYIPVTQRSAFDSAGDNWRVVGVASGVSLKARVIWKDNASTSNTWRIQDLDTFLTRAPGS